MATFDYRRDLTPPERQQTVLAGVGVGIAAGLAAAYLARVLLQRTPVAAPVVVVAGADAGGTPRPGTR